MRKKMIKKELFYVASCGDSSAVYRVLLYQVKLCSSVLSQEWELGGRGRGTGVSTATEVTPKNYPELPCTVKQHKGSNSAVL